MDSIRIDGSRGEGGGQTLRGAVALSCMSGVPVAVDRIRQGRRAGGLRPQHLSAVRVMARIWGAGVSGLEVGSSEIGFAPGQAAGADEAYEDIGTAGSIPLILQALIPAAAISGKRIAVTIRGGTDVPWSPTMDYTRFVLADALERFGIRCSIDVRRRGYYPRGAGEVGLRVEPCTVAAPVSLARGAGGGGGGGGGGDGGGGERKRRVDVACTFSGIGRGEVESACAGIADRLEAGGWDAGVRIAEEEARDAGAAVVLYGSDRGSVIGADALWDAKRGGGFGGDRDVAEEFMQSGGGGGGAAVGVDRNLADMLVIPASRADGTTVFRTDSITGHLETGLYVAARITGCRYGVGKVDGGFEVRIRGGGGGGGGGRL